MLQPEAVTAEVEEYSARSPTCASSTSQAPQAGEDGGKSFAEIRVMLSAQVAERDACQRGLVDLDAEATLVMMPNLAERYRRSIADLAQALSGDAVEVEQGRDALRCLIDAVVATPATEGRGVALEVRGRLAAMVGVANDNGAPRGAMSVMKTGVAGAGFEPATFRL